MENDLQNNQTDTAEKKKKSKKTLIAKIVNIVTGVFVVLALILTFEALYANKNLHNNYFGHAVLPVISDSMRLDNGGKDNFKRGDLIFVKILKDSDKKGLEVGDVITFKFYDHTTDTEQLNTHRIIKVEGSDYITQGDAIVDGVKSSERVSYTDVIGVYSGKIGGIGYVGLFMETKAGLFVMIVVPFILLLGISVFYFLKSFLVYNRQRTAESTQSTLLQEKERMRLEILAELNQNKQADGQESKDEDSATK